MNTVTINVKPNVHPTLGELPIGTLFTFVDGDGSVMMKAAPHANISSGSSFAVNIASGASGVYLNSASVKPLPKGSTVSIRSECGN